MGHTGSREPRVVAIGRPLTYYQSVRSSMLPRFLFLLAFLAASSLALIAYMVARAEWRRRFSVRHGTGRVNLRAACVIEP